MAVTTGKVTYSLKPETVDRLPKLATSWGMPKSEVIRRAVQNLDSKSIKTETPLEISSGYNEREPEFGWRRPINS